jgi:lysozyme
MILSERRKLVDQLIIHEGLRLFPYTDSVGKITIGVGHNLTDLGISQTFAMLLLEADVAETLRDCETLDWYGTLNSVRQRAIADLRFNLGLMGLLQFQHMIAAIKAQDWDGAARELLDSSYALQVKGRAQELAEMLRTGVDHDPVSPA